MLVGRLFEHRHRGLLMVGCEVGRLEDRRDLELARGDLVVARLCRYAEFEELAIDFIHEGHDAIRNDPEIVVLEFLALWRRGPKERATRGKQVRPSIIEHLVDQEILLLGAGRGHHARNVRMAEEFEDAAGLLVQGLHGLEKRRLGIQRLAGPGDKGRGNTESGAVGVLDDVSGARHIPRGVAAGAVRGAQSTRWERRSIGLTLDERLAFELGNGRPAVGAGIVKRIVLLRGGPGQRIEDMREVRCAAADRPVPHRLGHLVRHTLGQFGPVVDRFLNRFEGVRLEHLLHQGKAEGVRAEDRLGLFFDEVDRGALRFPGGDGRHCGGTG